MRSRGQPKGEICEQKVKFWSKYRVVRFVHTFSTYSIYEVGNVTVTVECYDDLLLTLLKQTFYTEFITVYGQRNILDGNIKRGRIPEYIVCSFSPPEMMTLEIKLEVKQNNKFNLQILCIK